MNWDRYKVLCDHPTVWSRWFIERLAELSDEAQASALRSLLTTQPLRRPSDHRGGAATQMFVTTLLAAEVRALQRVLAERESQGALPASIAARGLGGFQEALAEYLAYLSASDLASVASTDPTVDLAADPAQSSIKQAQSPIQDQDQDQDQGKGKGKGALELLASDYEGG